VNYALEQRKPTRHLVGIGAVVALHIAIGYALVNGLARHVVEVIKGPLETRLIEEIKPPPPPPEKLPPPPKQTAPPPPAFVPPPEVNVTPPVTAAPTITTTTVAPPPAPVVVETAPAPMVQRTPPVLDVNRLCERPEYPSVAARAEATGITRLAFLIDVDGRVLEARVEKASGATREHRLLDNAAISALSRCRFKAGTVDGKPERAWGRVDYAWKLD